MNNLKNHNKDICKKFGTQRKKNNELQTYMRKKNPRSIAYYTS